MFKEEGPQPSMLQQNIVLIYPHVNVQMLQNAACSAF